MIPTSTLDWRNAMRGTLSDTELLVLGLIAATPLHGHMLERIIQLTPMGSWLHVADKHVYYVLRKLEAAGYATFETETPPNAPTRKVYSATREGRRTLLAEVAWTERLKATDGVGFTIVFGLLPYLPELSDAEKTALLQVRRDALARLRASDYADESREFIRTNAGEPVLWIWERQQGRLDTELAWLDRLIGRVEQGGWQLAPPVSLDYVGGDDEGSAGR
jgi:DNA-binding PadR family transcriptional regulator